MNRLTIATIWIVLQLGFLGGWTVYEALRLLPGAGESILVRTAPVDPRDLLRGQYMRLRYEFSVLPSNVFASPNSDVWVVLRPQEGGDSGGSGRVLHEPVAYSAQRPAHLDPGEVLMKGRLDLGRSLDFGIERYFVPEGTETPNPRDLTVRLRVGSDHRPRIEAVYLRGQPWP